MARERRHKDGKLKVIDAPQELREIVVLHDADGKLERFAPSDEERRAILAVLSLLKGPDLPADAKAGQAVSGPMMGYPILFLQPTTFRIDIGRFIVHYRFDQASVWVAFIGVY